MIMIPDKYQRLHTLAHTDVLHRVYRNGIIDILAEVERLQKDLNDAEDVIYFNTLNIKKIITCALDMTSNDDAIALFKDFLGVEE